MGAEGPGGGVSCAGGEGRWGVGGVWAGEGADATAGAIDRAIAVARPRIDRRSGQSSARNPHCRAHGTHRGRPAPTMPMPVWHLLQPLRRTPPCRGRGLPPCSRGIGCAGVRLRCAQPSGRGKTGKRIVMSKSEPPCLSPPTSTRSPLPPPTSTNLADCKGRAHAACPPPCPPTRSCWPRFPRRPGPAGTAARRGARHTAPAHWRPRQGRRACRRAQRSSCTCRPAATGSRWCTHGSRTGRG